MTPVNQKNFNQQVLQSSKIVLVNFWAPWCGLCLMLNPILAQIESRWREELKVVSINADENLQLANRHRLRNLPTLILYNRGEIIHRFEGFHSREDLYQTVDQIVSSLVLESA
ncbi:MAG: thioredoxin family protein [Geminocystis sp.]|nr:thioredoxin family protein [Geminocystis sp.]HIK37188.1 thioredoxin family protein [Geminocystis sp. M7585_C2015_104]MCS7148421.1 thioredoxin family protein [Geminocystis sp.]MCX8078264.1 thioredoxin family protein [Geminocystis sp.]MDW8115991.1 thioredoxin family protein [Geminocystis sp.]